MLTLINDFALACSIDGSVAGYFTYHKQTMLIIQAEEEARSHINNFKFIEPFMGALISHECIHVVIKNIEGIETSDSLDDIEVIVEHNGVKLQVTLNNILFAKDDSGIVTW
jgi:hypothetical protein